MVKKCNLVDEIRFIRNLAICTFIISVVGILGIQWQIYSMQNSSITQVGYLHDQLSNQDLILLDNIRNLDKSVSSKNIPFCKATGPNGQIGVGVNPENLTNCTQ